MANLAHNKKAHFNYEILDTYEAGVELLGFEVKSVRKGQARLEGSYAIIRGGEVYLVGCHIPPYQAGNTAPTYDPDQTRKLLLSKKQIAEINKEVESRGLTIVPISMYNKGRFIKVELGLGKGKKLHDKRETIKKRDTNREIRREMKAR